mgnify:CR=1 FL=1
MKTSPAMQLIRKQGLAKLAEVAPNIVADNFAPEEGGKIVVADLDGNGVSQADYDFAARKQGAQQRSNAISQILRNDLDGDGRDEDADREAALWNAGALFDKFRHQSLRSQRVALIAARDDGDLDDEVLRTVLEGLDIEEAAAEERVRRRRAGSGAGK